MTRCLGCYERLPGLGGEEYHPKCSRRLFGTPIPPTVDFGLKEVEDLALRAINQHLGVTGVQPKVSLELKKQPGSAKYRLTVIGLWGRFILKPPTARYADMPVIEDVTMHMASEAGIETALHGLVRLKSGELTYVTRRFDREKGARIAVEDFCQLSELLTEGKYKTSMEKAGKIILRHSTQPGLDVQKFFEIAVFSFLTGNADMHLKNFSLIRPSRERIVLAPAYDLLATRLLTTDDPEEMALTVNAKKSRLRREDFETMGRTLRIPERPLRGSFERLASALPRMKALLERSFLPARLIESYAHLLDERASRLLG